MKTMKQNLITKMIPLGIMLTALGCSPSEEINREAALSVLKGYYTLSAQGVSTLKSSTGFDTAGVSSTTLVTINSLDFNIGDVHFSYLEIQDGLIVYQATFNGAINYTAFATDDVGNIQTEFTVFRASRGAISTSDGEHEFLNEN